ncbi:SMP-30/gluconolactonase/LRE family protein [Actinoplanes sp. NPDC023714]|uniref:SMP-30/gluconolactonase/LRE family protein n=1 Tax=Actinoplanes sp. NPDC023714 TaxID=3154322 RepID=UPI0033F28C4E
MTPQFAARPAGPGTYALAEGPVWDPARQRLLWVDIDGHAVHAGSLAAGVTPTGRWDFGATVGAVAVAADGSLLVAERETLTRVGPDGSRTHVARVLKEGHPGRLNDGAVDPAGRFLVGSLDPAGKSGTEVLVRLDDGGLTTIDDDLTLSNGLAWSPDGRTLYSIDTVPGVVWARDYEPLGERREAFRIADGHPDGMCADTDGNLWIAIWGGGRVECRTPEGRLLATVAVDAPHTSSVAFAGPDLDLLVVTTARQDGHSGSGRLFLARVNATGLLPPYWKGV